MSGVEVDIELKVTENQKKALSVLMDHEHTSVGYGGGAGGGKSFLGCIWLWIMCIKYPGVRYGIVRDTIRNLKRTTVISLEKFYSIYNIPEELRGKLNEQKSMIEFQNGSVILLLEGCYYPSDPLYNRFGSLELTGAFIEESPECPLDGIKILSTRVGRMKNEKYGILGKVLETFNPNPGHVYERFYLGKGGKKSIFIESLVYSNKFIDRGYIENLENADEKIKSRLLFGQWSFDDDAWLMFKAKDIHSMWTNEQTDGKYYIVCDVARFGVDTTRISLWRGNTRKRVWTYEKSSIEDVKLSILLIADQYKIDHANIIVDADGVGGGVVDGIPYCVGFVNNSKPIETGVKQNYANLKSQCAFELKRRIENHEIAIDREQPDKDKDWELLVQEMMNTYIDEKSIDGKTRIEPKEKMKERIGRSPDLLDTLIMRMLPYVKGINDNFIDNYLDSIAR